MHFRAEKNEAFVGTDLCHLRCFEIKW